MSFRSGQSDIYLKTFDGERWSEEVRLSESAADDWEPSVAIDGTGRIWVAWDSYEKGSYNILLRSVLNARPGEMVRSAASARYHARASVTTAAQNRACVAWGDSSASSGHDRGCR